MTPASHRPGVLPAPGAALALPGQLNTLARQLNTLPARVNTFAVKLNTFPPTVNTSANQGEHVGGQAGHVSRQTGHISGHTGLIGRETGHIGGSGWTHPLPSSTHAGAGRRCTTVAGIQPPPSRSLRVRCPRYRAPLAIRSPLVYNWASVLLFVSQCPTPLHPIPSASPHAARPHPRPACSHHARACAPLGPAPAPETRASALKIRSKLSLASPIPFGDRAGERQFPPSPPSLSRQRLVPNSRGRSPGRHGV